MQSEEPKNKFLNEAPPLGVRCHPTPSASHWVKKKANPLPTFLGAKFVESEDVIGASQFNGYPPRIFSTAPRTSLFKFNFTPAILTVHYPGTKPVRYSVNLWPPLDISLQLTKRVEQIHPEKRRD